jgi:hypothetical protein
VTREQRKVLIERYSGWAESWGLSLAFAVTQSLEKSERIVADAIVAMVATDREREARQASARTATDAAETEAEISAVSRAVARAANISAASLQSATRFARALWELSDRQAFRGFGTDAFFRMPAVARAIVVLKLKGRFSCAQIAEIVSIKTPQVDDHLENARLLFSDGRSWLAPGGEALALIRADGERWSADCPNWRDDLQTTFAHYVGNDLDADAGAKLHSHLVVCTTCRASLSHFKQQYTDWAGSIPVLDPDREFRRQLERVTRMALKARPRKGRPPSPMPGLRRVMRDTQVRAVFAIAAVFILVRIFFTHHHQ